MSNAHANHAWLAFATVLSAASAIELWACTPATPEFDVSMAGGGDAASSGSAEQAGVVALPSTGGAGPAASGADDGSNRAGVGGGLPAAGGTSASAGGAAGTSLGAGGAAGSNSAAGAGAGGTPSAAAGCNWLKAGDGSWSMNLPAADKIVLFDGKGLNQWHRLNEPATAAQWKVLPDGALQVVPEPTPTNIQSNAKFDDACLHVEYMTPRYPSNAGVQQRGNSGIYLKSAYEMQILDTRGLAPLIDGCGAVYKVSPPLEVACKQYEEWNVYEIEFKGSVWDSAGKKLKNATFVQVTLNGKLVQRDVSPNPSGGFTEAGIPEMAGPQPIALQDHRDYVSFRNIWAVVPLY